MNKKSVIYCPNIGEHLIVFILPSLKRGGGNRVIVEIANRLPERGIKVDIVCLKCTRKEYSFKVTNSVRLIQIDKGTTTSGINISKAKFASLLRLLYYVNFNYKKEKVIFTDPIMSIFIPLVGKKEIYRYIQSDDYAIFDDLFVLKNSFYLKLYKLFTKISYEYNVNFIFNSKFSYYRFLKISKRRDVPLKVVYPGIDHSIFYDRNLRKPGKINISIIARKHPLKRCIDFFKAIQKIQETNLIHQIKNIYVLSNDDLSDWLLNFNLKKLRYVFPRDDEMIAYYLSQSHIFVFTSLWEGFGLPPLEAMACGCAVILTNAGGINEYAKPGKNCLMYNPGDIKTLVSFLKILISDEKLRKKLSQNAVNTAKKFSWEQTVEQFLEILYD